MSHQYLNPADELQRLRLREVSVTASRVRLTRRGQRELSPPRPSVETASTEEDPVLRPDLRGQGSMSGFKAINAPGITQNITVPLPEDDSSLDSQDELPDPSTFVKPRTQPALERQSSPAEPSNICGRDWPVMEILSKRAANGRSEWLLKWKPSTLLEKDIRRRSGRHDYVRCDGNDFEISSDSPAPPSEDGKSQRVVIWEDTWRFIGDLAGDLSQLWQLMQAYELLHPETNQPNSGHHGVVLDNEHEFGLSQYVRTRIRRARDQGSIEKGSKLLSLLKKVPKRPLIFRDGLVDLECKINYGCLKGKSTALLIYDTGVEQQEPCGRCQQGGGPFPTCVVDNTFNNGACAGCIYEREGPRCNFSTKYEGEDIHPAIRRAAVSEPGSAREESPAHAASSVAESPLRDSSVAQRAGSEDTNPTSPILPSSSEGNEACTGDEEIEQLPCFARLQQEIDQANGESSRENPSLIEVRSALAALSSSEQNARLLDGNLGSHQDYSPALPGAESVLTPVRFKNSKRKREDSPSDLAVRRILPMREPLVDNITFDHPTCSADAPCIDGQAGYQITWTGAGPSKLPNTVYKHARFDEAEATDEQVKFIISHCTCRYAAYFQSAWEHYCIETTKKGKKRKRTKESYLSKGFWREINWVINKFCPARPDAPVVLGDSAELAIPLDDD